MWIDSIQYTGDLWVDNTARGAETTRDWFEYVISNNLTLLVWANHVIYLDPDM